MGHATIETLDAVPAELRERRQWVLRDAAKRPLQCDGRAVSSTNPATWTTFAEAVAALRANPSRFAGVGFVFTKDDSFVGVDLDDCRDAATGSIEPWAASIIESLDSYAEVSPSGTGVKLWCRGELPGDGSGRKATHESGAVECYQHSRYFAVTGQAVGGAKAVRHCQPELTAIWQTVFGAATTANSSGELPPDPESRATAEEIAEFLPRLLALPRAVEGRDGSGATIHAACEIRRAGVHGDAGRKLLDVYNEHRCEPPWSERELDHKWESARRKVLPAGWEFDELPYTEGAGNQSNRAYKPFPVHVLPEPLSGFVTTAAKSIGCDESYVALPLLTMLAAAIGNARTLELKPGWQVPSILWSVIIGESGTAKSPAANVATKAIHERQRAALARHAEQMRRLEDDIERSAIVRTARKATADDSSNPQPKPEIPDAERVVVGDTTVEALAPILQNNPRGVLLHRDELDGWFGSFDKYAKGGGGADESHWLSMYHAQRLQVDRKTGAQRTVYVPQASVSITGGIQPGVFRRALGIERKESGLAARFLMACPPPRSKRWTESGIDAAAESQIRDLVKRLYDLQPDTASGGNYTPVVATLSPAAKAAWIEFYNSHAAEQSAMTGELASAWSKMEETAARLALVIHYARWAVRPQIDPTAATENELFGDGAKAAAADGPSPVTDVLDADSIAAGVALIEWFKGEAVRVYAMLRESIADAGRRRLAEWIRAKGGSVTVRDVHAGCRWLRDRHKAEAALEDLAANGLGKWESTPSARRGHAVRRLALTTLTVDTGTLC